MFKLPPLPYDLNALEPAISARTLEFHHGKHHAAYVKKTNDLAKKKGLEGALRFILCQARSVLETACGLDGGDDRLELRQPAVFDRQADSSLLGWIAVP